MVIKETFGSRLRRYRKEKGLSGHQLAELVGVKPASIYELEDEGETRKGGVREPRARTVLRAAFVLDVEPWHLLTGEGERTPNAVARLAMLDLLPDDESLHVGYRFSQLSPEDKETIRRMLRSLLPGVSDNLVRERFAERREETAADEVKRAAKAARRVVR